MSEVHVVIIGVIYVLVYLCVSCMLLNGVNELEWIGKVIKMDW